MYERVKVDTLRGMACVLLVAYHVIGFNIDSGLRLHDGFLRNINDALVFIRMPLFTFLSGLVYAKRPFVSGGVNFISKKVRRLILPMLTVGTIFALLQAFTPGTNNTNIDLYTLHIKPVAHFWFVESLFIVFSFILICEKMFLFDSFKKFLIVFIFAVILYISPVNISYFSLSGFIYLLPYFLFGMAVVRFKYYLSVSNRVKASLLSLLIVFVALIYVGHIPLFEHRSLINLLAGCLGCILLLTIGFKSKALAWLGGFSYSIYLFHVFYTVATRILLHKLDFYNTPLLFIVGLMAGLLLPIVTEKVLRENRFTSIMLLGRSGSNK